jgi:acyl-CoA thioester hydrolase
MVEQRYLGAGSFDTAVLSTRIAQPKDIDELGHVNNAVYVRWVQDAAVAHWFAAAPEEIDKAHIWVCSRHEIDYLGEIREGDEVEIRTWLGEASGARFSRHVDIRKPGARRASAKALTWWVLLDRATARPRRVDDGMIAIFGLDPANHRPRKD